MLGFQRITIEMAVAPDRPTRVAIYSSFMIWA